LQRCDRSALSGARERGEERSLQLHSTFNGLIERRRRGRFSSQGKGERVGSGRRCSRLGRVRSESALGRARERRGEVLAAAVSSRGEVAAGHRRAFA
jgi:hypothetical protein